MSFNVRIFAYRGIQQIRNVLPKQFSSDSVYQMIEPYEWGQTLVADAAAVSSAAVAAPDATQIIRVEVPDQQMIRYEINPPNRPGGVVVANANSPSLSGKDYFYFQPSWTISIINADALP